MRWPNAYAIGTVAISSAAADVGDEHHLPTAGAPVDPAAGVEREDEVRDERDRRQCAHLPGGRVEREHRRQRKCDQRDLVADERYRLADEVAAEVRVLAEQRRQHRRQTSRTWFPQGTQVQDSHGQTFNWRRYAVEHLAHLARQAVGVERLLQERDARLEHAVVSDRRVGVAGDVEHVRPGPHRGNGACDVGAAHSRHHDVRHEQVDRAGVPAEQFERRRPVACLQHRVAARLEDLRDEPAHDELVLDEQDRLFAVGGRNAATTPGSVVVDAAPTRQAGGSRNDEPRPGAVSTSIVPPLCSTMP